MNKKFPRRILGNWLTSFLTPLMGMGLAFNLPIQDMNLKLLISALIGATIMTGLVIGRELERGKNNG